jgi:hypothetical protein
MKREKRLTLIVGIVLALAAIGLTISMSIIRKEGIEGLWNRKKDFIKKGHPEAGPILDEAERQVRKTKPGG